MAAPGELVIETFGFKRAVSLMEQMGVAASEGQAFWHDEIIPDLLRLEYQTFVSQGRRGGGSWRFLQPETIARKVSAGLDPRINIATGALMESVTKGWGSESEPEYAVREVGPTFLRFGTRAPGAAESQKFRPFLRITRFDRARWARMWVRYVVRIARMNAEGEDA